MKKVGVSILPKGRHSYKWTYNFSPYPPTLSDIKKTKLTDKNISNFGSDKSRKSIRWGEYIAKEKTFLYVISTYNV